MTSRGPFLLKLFYDFNKSIPYIGTFLSVWCVIYVTPFWQGFSDSLKSFTLK